MTAERRRQKFPRQRLKRIVLLRVHSCTERTRELRLQPDLLLEPSGATEVVKRWVMWTLVDKRIPATKLQKYYSLSSPENASLPGELFVVPAFTREPPSWVLTGLQLAGQAVNDPLTLIAPAEERLIRFSTALRDADLLKPPVQQPPRAHFIYVEYEPGYAWPADDEQLRALVLLSLKDLNLQDTGAYTWRALALTPEGIVIPAGPVGFALGDILIGAPSRHRASEENTAMRLPTLLYRLSSWTAVAHLWGPTTKADLEKNFRSGDALLNRSLRMGIWSIQEATSLGHRYSTWLPTWLKTYSDTRADLAAVRRIYSERISLAGAHGRLLSLEDTHFKNHSLFAGVAVEFEDLFADLEHELDKKDRYVNAFGEHLRQAINLVVGEANLSVQKSLLRLTWLIALLTILLLALTGLVAIESPTLTNLLQEIARTVLKWLFSSTGVIFALVDAHPGSPPT